MLQGTRGRWVWSARLIVLCGIGLLLGGTPVTPRVYPIDSQPYGLSYGEWLARFHQWSMSLPLDGHPQLDTDEFDVTEGQSGKVWFLAAPFGTVERTITIPRGISLYFEIEGAECSSLEPPDSGFHGDTEEEQRACAKFYTDHIVDVFCEVDGVEVKDLGSYRFVSPQFTFTAPTPWIFADVGGTGTSVADAYAVMLAPLSAGQHTLHYIGMFHFSVADGDPFDGDFGLDMTYHIKVK
jgi:hypothetical protein